jgi:hypothetical protein
VINEADIKVHNTTLTDLNNLIIRFFPTNQRKKRFDVQLGELWTVDRGQSTIIRSFK